MSVAFSSYVTLFINKVITKFQKLNLAFVNTPSHICKAMGSQGEQGFCDT